MQLLHLGGRKRCDFIRTKGRTWNGRYFTVRWLPGVGTAERARPEGALYVGTFAGARLHKSAVIRNRMRRRCRDALRLATQDIPPADFRPTCLLISPRSSSLNCDFSALLSEVRAFLSTIR